MEQKIIGNRYQILDSIGTGGMAEVYKAFDTFLNREVAVKILRAQYTDDEDLFHVSTRSPSAARFYRIVNVYDVGRDDDSYYIKRNIKGKTLMEYNNLSWRGRSNDSVNNSAWYCFSLEHAHSRDYSLRIKPHKYFA
jgi:serine/threonine-protein kinase